MKRRTQTSPVATCRASSVRSFVAQSPDCEETIHARCLERGHRRLRPHEDEQLAPERLLALARAEEQVERGHVDESDHAKVDGQVAHFCQRVFDRRGVEKVGLASEDEDRGFAPTPLEGQREVGSHPSGLRQVGLVGPRWPPAHSTCFGRSGVDLFLSHHAGPL